MNRISGLQAFQVLRYASLTGIGILLANSSLDMRLVGWYEGLMLISGLTGFFWTGALMNALVPLYAGTAEPSDERMLHAAHRLLWTLNTPLVALLALLGPAICQLAGLEYPGPWIWGSFCLYVLGNNPAYLIEYTYLLRGQTALLVRYGLLNALAQMLAAGLPALLGWGLEGSMTGLAGVALIKALWLMRLVGLPLRTDNTAKERQALLHMALPLCGSLLLGGSSAYLDGLIVAHHLDAEQLALFRYGAREFPLVLLLANAFSSAVSAQVATDWKAGLAVIRQRSLRMLLALMPLTLGLLLSSAWWFPRIFRPEFAASHTVFNIYLLLLLPRVFFPQTLLTGLGLTGVLLRVSLLEAALNLGLSLLWVQRWGMEGVAWATVVAYCADKALLAAYLWRFRSTAPSAYAYLPAYAAAALILALSYILVS